MSMFMMVTDDSGDRYAINTESISWISPGTCNVCMSGTSGQGDGLMTLSPEDIKRLLDILGVAENGTD